MNFIKLFGNINLCYLILELLGFVVGILFLNSIKVQKREKIIFSILYLIISFVSFQYLNGVVENIFKLKMWPIEKSQVEC